MVEEGEAVDRRLDTTAAEVEVTHAKRVFQAGDDGGDNGL